MAEMIYDPGDIARLTTVFTDVDTGDAIDPTSLSATVRAPDGTTTTYTDEITHDSLGNYHLDISVTLPGRWSFKFVGAGAATDTGQGTFRVAEDTTATDPVSRFASADELAARLGLFFSEAENARANILLDMASALIRSETDQTIYAVTDETLTRSGTPESSIRLPQRPVTSVASVSIDGAPLASTAWFLSGDEVARSRATLGAGFFGVGLSGSGFGGPQHTVTVVYSHGFPVTPGIVKSVCLEMVVRVWVNPGAVARESVGNTSAVYDNMKFSPSGLVMTDDERKAVNKLTRRVAGTVNLR